MPTRPALCAPGAAASSRLKAGSSFSSATLPTSGASAYSSRTRWIFCSITGFCSGPVAIGLCVATGAVSLRLCGLRVFFAGLPKHFSEVRRLLPRLVIQLVPEDGRCAVNLLPCALHVAERPVRVGDAPRCHRRSIHQLEVVISADVLL